MRFWPGASGDTAREREQAQELERLEQHCAALLEKVESARQESGEFRRRSQRSQAELERTRTELERTRAELERTRAELERTRTELQQAHTTIGNLKLLVADLQKTLFGRKSEKPSDPGPEPKADPKPPPGPGDSPDKPDKPDKAGKGRKQKAAKRKRGRQPGSATPPRRDRSRLPKIPEPLELPEHERRCAQCDTPFVRCGTKSSKIFEMHLAALAREIERQCYEPGCACAPPGRLVAPPAPRLWSGTQLGTSVWAWSVVQVFHMHRPQAAVARELDAIGLGMAPATLARGLQRLALLVQPLEQAIAERLGQARVVQADETSWPVQNIEGQDNAKQPPASGARPKHWLWMVCCEDAVWMRILPTRGLPSGRALLGKLGQGKLLTLVCDCWSVYPAFAKRSENVRLQFCWAHQRRHYCRVEAGFPELEPWATDWLERIGEVFHLAHLRRRAWQPELPLQDQAEDFEAAQASLQASLGKLFDDALQEWRSLVARYEMLIAVPSGGRTGAELAQVEARGKATASLILHKAGLSVFLEDPAIPMDNNYAERTLRGPVISRRLSFGSGGPAGAETAGRLLSVLQTARVAGLNPYRYMLDWLDACARNRGQAPSELSPWLPWEMDEQRIEELRAPPIRWWTPANGPPAAAPADAPDSTFPPAA